MAPKPAGRRPARPRSTARPSDRFADAQRVAVLVLVAASALMVLPHLSDTFNLPKFCVVALFLVVLVVTATRRIAEVGYPTVPGGAFGLSVAAFVAALVVATIEAPSWTVAVVGSYGRYDGLVTYLSCLSALVVIARTFTVDWLSRLRFVVVASAAAVAVVALVEEFSRHVFGAHIAVQSTVGNVDFLGAYLAIAVPISLSLTCDGAQPRAMRVSAAGAAAVDLGASAVAGAQQGLMTAIIGTAVLAAILFANSRRRRWVSLLGVLVFGAVIAGIVAAGLWGHGPLGALGREPTVIIRRLYWHTATAMLGGHPVTGVGLASFGDHYFQYWRVHATHRLGAHRYADAANSVPLTMFAEGGVLLGTAYLCLVAVVAFRFARAFRAGLAHPALFAGLVAGWVSYQAQSLVSIDKLTLVVIGWVLAGAVLAMTEPRFVEVRRTSSRRTRSPSRANGAFAVAVVAGVVLCVPLVALLRADSRIWAGRHAGSPVDGVRDEIRGADIVGWVPTYADQAGQQLLAGNAPADALVQFQRALSSDPRDRTAGLGVAAAEESLGDLDAAATALASLAKIDVHDPVLLEELAELDARRGDLAAARRVIGRAAMLHSDPSIVQLEQALAQQPK